MSVGVPSLPVRWEILVGGVAAEPGEAVVVTPGDTVVELRLRGGGAAWSVTGTATLPVSVPSGGALAVALPAPPSWSLPSAAAAGQP